MKSILLELPNCIVNVNNELTPLKSCEFNKLSRTQTTESLSFTKVVQAQLITCVPIFEPTKKSKIIFVF